MLTPRRPHSLHVSDARFALFNIKRDIPGNRVVGLIYGAKADGEMILCAGAFGSPQLLMLSGFDDRAHLAHHGIPLVKDLPGVGADLQDHVAVPIQYTAKKPVSPRWLIPLTQAFLDVVSEQWRA